MTTIGSPLVQSAPGAPRNAPLPSNPKGAMGKNEFMKLLVAQMTNQDPMNPMNGEQMAAQLAQFSSLEQLMNIGNALQAQSSGQSALLNTVQGNSAVAMIGKTVVAESDEVVLQNGDGTVFADVEGTGGKATLSILDANGQVVGTRDLGTVRGGRHSFGIGDAGKDLADGRYSFRIDVTDTAGKPVDVTTYTRAAVTGVQNTAAGPVLLAGPLTIPLERVVEVSDK